jgi:uncharacterized protein YfdQ (DUF2303 family)
MSDMSKNSTEAEVIAHYARESVPSVAVNVPRVRAGEVPVIEKSTERELVSLEKFLPAPVRKDTTLHFTKVASLAAYVSKHGDDDSLVQVFDKNLQIVVVLDAHTAAEPRWGKHQATFKATRTIAWEAWRSSNEKWMSQRDFIDFLDDRMLDIIEPAAADLQDMMRIVRIIKDGSFASEVSKDGTGQAVGITNEVKAKVGAEALELPTQISLMLPIFEGTDVVKVQARLKVRPDDGNLKMSYSLRNYQELERDQFDVLAADFSDECQLILPVYYCA